MKITNRLKLALKSILSLKFGEVATDKATLIFDGEEIAEGVEVFVKDENDEVVAASDGEYTTEDGRTITVAEGKVTAIKEKETEENKENEAEPEQMENEIEPADAPNPEEIEQPEDKERIAALEGTVAELKSALEQILNGIAALEGRIEEVEGKVAKVESEPSAEPIEENPVEEHKMSRLAYLRKK